MEHGAESASRMMIHFTASRYLAVAGCAVMLYDHITTLSDEIELIWMKPINTISIIFFIIRYFGMIVIGIAIYDKGGLARGTSKQFCINWLWAETYFQILIHGLIHAMIAFRVCALWGRTRIINWTLGISFTLYICSTTIIASLAVLPFSDEMYFHPTFHMCFVNKLTPWLYWVWVPPMALEVLLFGLTLVRAVRYHKTIVLMMPFARVLYRDGILYFVGITVCTVFNIIAWSALPPTLITLAKYFGFAFVNAMGSKLILNLRGINVDEDFMVATTSIPSALPVFALKPIKSSDHQHHSCHTKRPPGFDINP